MPPASNRIEKYCYTREDFEIEWFSGTGPGGQNRNKIQACVRIRHKQSGLVQTCTSHRSRQQNFSEAFKTLGIRLKKWITEEIKKENAALMKKSSETIRTYHAADNRVKDHLSKHQIRFDELEKKFGDLIEKRAGAMHDAV